MPRRPSTAALNCIVRARLPVVVTVDGSGILCTSEADGVVPTYEIAYSRSVAGALFAVAAKPVPSVVTTTIELGPNADARTPPAHTPKAPTAATASARTAVDHFPCDLNMILPA